MKSLRAYNWPVVATLVKENEEVAVNTHVEAVHSLEDVKVKTSLQLHSPSAAIDIFTFAARTEFVGAVNFRVEVELEGMNTSDFGFIHSLVAYVTQSNGFQVYGKYSTCQQELQLI